MKKIFSKIIFPKAPGGDRYEWKEAKTTFNLSRSGLFAIYDFQKVNLPSPFTHLIKYAKGTVNNTLDIGEAVEVIHNYEIEIHTIETISL